MLHAHANAVALDTFYIRGGHFAGKQRIFREILEVAAAKRIAMQVQARSQEDIRTVLAHFLAHGFGKLFDQFGIPSGCQHCPHREARAIESLARSRTCRVDAKTGRSVRENGLGNAQTWNGTGCASGAGNQRRIGSRQRTGLGIAPASPNHQRGFLLEGHSLEDLIDVALGEAGLCAQRKDAAKGCKQEESLFHILNQ